MKQLFTLFLVVFAVAGCSSAFPASEISPGNQNSLSATSEGPVIKQVSTQEATPKPGAIIVRPPIVPVEPIQGTPVFPVPTSGSEEWQTFNSPSLGVAVNYPSSWIVIEQAGGVAFVSPTGSKILLQLTKTDDQTNSDQQCADVVTAYGLTANTCYDAVSNIYSARYMLASANGSMENVMLSTTEIAVVDVYKTMLNSLHPVK